MQLVTFSVDCKSDYDAKNATWNDWHVSDENEGKATDFGCGCCNKNYMFKL